MSYLSNICFVCLKNTNLIKVVQKDINIENILVEHVKYVLPELMILDWGSYSICSSCHTALDSCYNFKKMCLDNLNRIKHYINILQKTRQNETIGELKINTDVSLVEQEHEVATEINIKEDIQDSFLTWKEQNDQKTFIEDSINIKEESTAFEDIADREFYQHLIKSESLQDEVQNGDFNSTSENDNQLNKETNYFKNCSKILLDNCDSIEMFKCGICNIKFTETSDLQTHMKIHEDNKDFKCEICSKKYIFESYLHKHMKSHENIKYLQCPICNKKFSKRYNLQTHIKFHKGIREFECVTCKKRFVKKSGLERHMKIHEKIQDYEYDCPVCYKKFTKSSSLQNHMKFHERYKYLEDILPT